MKAHEYRTGEDKYIYDYDGVKVYEFPEVRELVVESPKHLEFFIVYKPVGKYNNYSIRFNSGKVVPQLAGQFMSLQEARDKIINYIHRSKESKMSRAAFLAEEREKRKRAKSKPDTGS